MDASFIKSILAKKHRKDFYVAEAPTGPAYNIGTVRLDFWAMKISWKESDSSGYEIKVSRQDFLNDSKWNSYLKYCNRFYFVCPTGLIKVDEIDPMVGLIYISDKGYMKVVKAAIFRDIIISPEIYKYVLLKHFYKKVESEPVQSREELIKEYVDGKINSFELGNQFRSKLVYEINNVKFENNQLKAKLQPWEEIIKTSSPKDFGKPANDIDINMIEYHLSAIKRELDRSR